ncbi:MAG: haloacid dehalogenase-like hydrolase [Gemmatimonadaceae bacterium]|nr:haloacid dehalogenase-like hydrolase [Gemmatimonadaceae bacterium]
MKLVLFDIDGTILWTDGAGRRSMEGALLEVFGKSGDPHYRYDGKTDRQIAREQMRVAGFDDATITARMDATLAAYVRRLDVELARDAGVSRLCSGVLPLLDAVEQHEGATMGLLTGNIEHGARRKLTAVGVSFTRFQINAFGSDHEERPQLPLVARRRAEVFFGRPFDGSQMVIIGDTPADIECGRSLGVRAIGVATGRYSVDDLAAHKPAAVFATLDDTAAVLDAMLA